jgi:transposase
MPAASRRWPPQGRAGVSCRLSDAQLQRLRTELERGPAEHGWADQRWTLARVATVIGRLFHLRYTPRGTAYLLPPDGLVAAGAPTPRGASATRTRSPHGAP